MAPSDVQRIVFGMAEDSKASERLSTTSLSKKEKVYFG